MQVSIRRNRRAYKSHLCLPPPRCAPPQPSRPRRRCQSGNQRFVRSCLVQPTHYTLFTSHCVLTHVQSGAQLVTLRTWSACRYAVRGSGRARGFVTPARVAVYLTTMGGHDGLARILVTIALN